MTAPPRPKPKFVAIRERVMQGSERVALASSRSMARRIALALNHYDPGPRFVTAPREPAREEDQDAAL